MKISWAASWAVLALGLALVAGQDDHDSHEDHDDHSHEEGHPEAAFVYDVGIGTNSFVLYPADGSFLDETFAFMIVPTDTADEDGLHEAEEEIETVWDGYASGDEEPTVLTPGMPATPSSAVVYQVALEEPVVLVPVNVTTAGAHAVFLEHGSSEIGTAMVSPEGFTLIAGAEEGGEDDDEDEESSSADGTAWVNAMVATTIVSAVSLAGLVLLVNKNVAHTIDLSQAFMFASAAILTASLMHIIPESLEGLEERYPSLHDLGLYAGLTTLAGIVFCIIVHALLDGGESHGHGAVTADGKTVGDSANSTQLSVANLQELMVSTKGRSLWDIEGLQPVCWNVIIGDFVHNFADGIAIGAAFLTCSLTMGWTVTASIVVHEVPHEVADFMALLRGGMSVKQAFFYNFISALTAILGAVIVLALGDTLNDLHISIILLIGAGTFVFIGLTELLPDALKVTDAVRARGRSAVMKNQLLKLASFLFGAIVIGVPLMFDEHCGDGHDHDH